MALLTGRYPLSIGMPDDEMAVAKEEGLPLDETTVAEVLQHNGYTTYMFGKWNLGNASPRYVPTARGFDYFMGFLNGYQFYWSKLVPDDISYRDISYSDKNCFYMYDSSDMEHYSTHLYQDKAILAIQTHDFVESSMFLYLAFQAVHNPFSDNQATFPNGIPDSYVNASVLEYIDRKIKGTTHTQYHMAMSIMDTAVANVYSALEDRGVMDNTYIMFASDNGGCPAAGGRNTPLRGTKGSLFEGGVRVEAFIYSPLLEQGVYDNIFHVTDWFPTILEIAEATYKPESGYHLDGVSQFQALSNRGDPPRDHMLLNYYYDPYDTTKNLWTGKAAGVRNARYKLMHTFDNKWSGAWYIDDEMYEMDDDFTQYGGCSVTTAISSGTFTHFLFDLDEVGCALTLSFLYSLVPLLTHPFTHSSFYCLDFPPLSHSRSLLCCHCTLTLYPTTITTHTHRTHTKPTTSMARATNTKPSKKSSTPNSTSTRPTPRAARR